MPVRENISPLCGRPACSWTEVRSRSNDDDTSDASSMSHSSHVVVSACNHGQVLAVLEIIEAAMAYI